MYSALTYSKPLAGILALSSWLPLHNVLQEVILHMLYILSFQAYNVFILWDKNFI